MTSGEHPALARALAEARRDDDTIGLLLHGSQAVGGADADSDYDLIWVLAVPAQAGRAASGRPSHVRDERGGAVLDVVLMSLADLQEIVDRRDWRLPGLAGSRLLLDKTGELGALHDALNRMPAETAREEVAAQCGAYLNGFYRSLKAWRRGDALAARLCASESLVYLVRALFALERRWPPYTDWLRARLDELRPQGWADGELEAALLEIVSTGDPGLQRTVEDRVEALLRERGFATVIDSWFGELERVKVFEPAMATRREREGRTVLDSEPGL